MNALRTYRDDGPLAGFVAGRLAAARTRRARTWRATWLVPPLLRALEYAALVALTSLVEPGALPACFALLAVLAFHQYDTAYRLRQGGPAPARWTGLVGGGWDGRVLAAVLLAAAGLLRWGLIAGAVALGALWVGESARSWLRFRERGSPPPLADAGDVVE